MRCDKATIILKPETVMPRWTKPDATAEFKQRRRTINAWLSRALVHAQAYQPLKNSCWQRKFREIKTTGSLNAFWNHLLFPTDQARD
mmetsp:Transcript_14123/g.16079  ORF Transcript_14123/g.16079 Transcript_14123/m.16079 type:complete len:87 (-) Transcript_14123:24-284(-)